MADLIYPTSSRISGPILIDATSLKELEGVIGEQMPVLRAFQKEMVERYVEERVGEDLRRRSLDDAELAKKRETWSEYAWEGYRLGQDSRELTVYFSDGSHLKARSFDEAAAHAEVSGSRATSFFLRIKGGDVTLKAEARSGYGTYLAVSVDPSNYEVSRTVFSALSRWVRKVEAPSWQRWWCSIGQNAFGAWSIFMMLALLLLVAAYGSTDSTYYKTRGRELVKEGLSQSNQQKAIEVLLALASDSAAPIEHRPPTWFWFFVVGGVFVCLILTFPPEIELGLGVGERRIACWRTWARFVFVVVPGFIAANFFWPYIVEATKKMASR